MIELRSSRRRALVALLALGALLATTPLVSGDTPPAAPVAVTAVDLGQGLRYVRVHRLPGDLPTSGDAPGSLAIDLRFSASEAGGVEALAAWLKFRTSPARPTFVLCNEESDAAVRDALTSVKDTPGLLTIGPAADHFEPDIVIDVTADEDRAAYRAFESGTSLPQLLAENADKVRNDEAALARERTPVAGSDQEAPAATDPVDSKANTPPPIDRVLQRAIQIHRGLVVLKRVPAASAAQR